MKKQSKKTVNRAKMLYADSEKSADMLYLGGVFVPDPFLAFVIGGKRICFVNGLEYGRVSKSSAFDAVYSLEEALIEAAAFFKKKKAELIDLIKFFVAKNAVDELIVPMDFPAWLYAGLQKESVAITVCEGLLFPERAIKTAEQAALIEEGNQASIAGFMAVEAILEKSLIKNGFIYYKKQLVTAEMLKAEIEIACLRSGGISSHTIVACGDQACDPHCGGSGPIKPNELIIVDIFPRVKHTGYFGDMTRTFLKGKASSVQKKLVKTVKTAQSMAIKLVSACIAAKVVHQVVCDHFEQSGYKTEKVNGVPQGFIHSTGHGVGLDIHEMPRLSNNADKLEEGMVVTVEPGLYYPGVGACRIEDVVLVKKAGHKLLSQYHYKWEIE